MFSVMGGSYSLCAVLYGRHCLGYHIGLVRNDVKLRTPGTPMVPYDPPFLFLKLATYTLVTFVSALPGIADFIGPAIF